MAKYRHKFRQVRVESRQSSYLSSTQVRAYFSEHEGLLVVYGVEAVGGNDLGPVLSSDGVRRQPVHVDLEWTLKNVISSVADAPEK